MIKNSFTITLMEIYQGQFLKIKTDKDIYEGVMTLFDKENGKVVIEKAEMKYEMNFNEILSISLPHEDNSEEKPTSEIDMYSLFYEAFNIYGPFEDQFIYTVASALKKFMREISSSNIKIIIGSDDIFGRIGLCFARIALGRVKYLSVELQCDLFDLNSLKYKNSYLNSGGVFDDECTEEKSYSLILFACNRNCKFEKSACSSNQIILLDIPQSVNIPVFTGLGLGFIPENYKLCNRSCYVVDVGLGSILTKKYKLPQNYKNSLAKLDLNIK